MTRVTAYAFSFKALKDGDIRLSNYVGKPILIVNTASLCGYTPQYTGLQALWTRYRDKGLMIVAVPSNDFGGQEPGGEAEIEHTAHQYAVSFPVADKASVKARRRILSTNGLRPSGRSIRRAGIFTNIWSAATDISRRFSPRAVEPTDPRVIAAIEKELDVGGDRAPISRGRRPDRCLKIFSISHYYNNRIISVS